MGFDDDKKEGKGIADSDSEIEHEVHENKIGRQMSESSMYTTEDEEEEENTNKIELGPQFTLKETFEKDKVGVFEKRLNFYGFFVA